jgi:hypothetical protein
MFDPIRRDIERVTGRAPHLKLPPVPGVGENGPRLPAPRERASLGEPTSPSELLAQIPAELEQTARTALELLTRAPEQVARDATLALTNLMRVPRELGQELFQTPGQLAQRLAPSNLNQALATIRESADFKDVTDPRQLREKMRTITDVVDLFTPT